MNDKLKQIRFNLEIAEEFYTKILAFTLGPVELKDMLSENKAVVLDVRKKEDYDKSHIPSAISMPKTEISQKLGELSKENLYVVYCYNQQCHLGVRACQILTQNGYHCMHLEGGFKTWVEDFRFAVST